VPVVLFRVDERLIHGQVVMGWGVELEIVHYVVVDDELRESSWEQDLYRLGLPEGTTVEFLTVDQVSSRLEILNVDRRRTVLLTRSLAAMKGLAEQGILRGREVNVGGLHYAAGRTERLSYVFLGEAEEADLRAIVEQGVGVSARDLPGSRSVGVTSLLVRP
jgi:mannose/fructose/N-acetylgalactosamine-specific phosphotransferase system component IIB